MGIDSSERVTIACQRVRDKVRLSWMRLRADAEERC